VTLNLDVFSPIRSLPRQRELIIAIHTAPPSTQETNWVEWKSQVDLGEKRWQTELSRQVLAMANRDPEVAAKAAAGCGLVVVGASPGELVGTVIYDSAMIEAWLTPYVGRFPDAPQWASAYVEVDGKQVLILTIEPPEVGHRAWPCRKTYSPDPKTGADQKMSLRDGAVYVRHQASTVEATAADHDMLSRRAAGARRRISGISLLVAPSCRAVSLDVTKDAVAAWTDREREAMKPAPPAQPRPWSAPPGSSLDATAQRLVELAEQANWALAKSALFVGETRTPEAYQTEVDAYIAKATKALQRFVIRRAHERKLGRVAISVANNTDDPIHRLQVELLIDAPGILVIADADMPTVTLPKRPVMLGKATRSVLDSLAGFQVPNYGIASGAAPLAMSRRVKIDHHSKRLTFDPIDLYAEEAVDLEEFYLVANPQYAGATLTGQWTARASDVGGVIRDTFEIEVDPKVWTIDELVAEDAKPSADHGDKASEEG
jgi:hypothetical protein